jgi:signal transduction histidine kinase
VRGRRPVANLAAELIADFSMAEDVSTGMLRVATRLGRVSGVERAEWWAPGEDGSSWKRRTSGCTGRGPRTAFPLGPVGALVVVGAGWTPQLTHDVMRLDPVVRRRWTEERLAAHAALLARRVEALEDFAALVAHELKAPLQAALLVGDPAGGAETALELVDSVLEAVRSESATEVSASPAVCLGDALHDLGAVEAEVVASLPDEFPIPPAALRVILRNLVSNSLAAGARHIHVSAVAAEERSTLVVDDDGTGLEAPDRYATGSRLGLSLCARLAARFGGSLEIGPRARGGTRATLAVEGGER